MTAHMDDIYVDFDSGHVLLFADETDDSEVTWIPFSDLGIDNSEGDDDNKFVFDFEFTVKNIYDDSSGKYGVQWGNAAFIDCNYVFD